MTASVFEHLTHASQRAALEAFARALRREVHNLLHRPELLWQQFYNRLQWEDEPVPQLMALELALRSVLGATPWLKRKTPFRESKALIRTLSGHTSYVRTCAVSPDGSFVVSASVDKTLKIWDAKTGRERATLEGHTREVFVCAVSPDGSFVVSASNDKTLKIWDAKTGQERATLRGHTDRVSACAVSPDGSFVVSASNDQTLKLWDTKTGQERANIWLLGGLRGMALHPKRSLAVCGDYSGNLYMVDLINVDYKPIIVTAVDLGLGPRVRCPSCLTYLPLEKDWLGQEIACPEPHSDGRMRVNPFVVDGPLSSAEKSVAASKPTVSEKPLETKAPPDPGRWVKRFSFWRRR